MPTIDAILAERRRQERIRTDPDYAARFQPISEPLPTPGGGGSPTPYAQTREGIIFSAEQQRLLLGVQRENQAALARRQHSDALIRQQEEQTFQTRQLERRLAEERKVRAEERERTRQANINTLLAERQAYFGKLMKSGDQARAVIFALGYGPENDAFDVRARALGTSVKELRGAQALRRTTQSALSRVLDRRVTIGREGVRGLGTAISSARAFVQGGIDIQTLLSSAFGVGSLREGEQPGMSPERLAELIREVTPQGVL
jgi:hypothetical protein